MRRSVGLALVAAVVLSLALTTTPFTAVRTFAQAQGSRVALSTAEQRMVRSF